MEAATFSYLKLMNGDRNRGQRTRLEPALEDFIRQKHFAIIFMEAVDNYLITNYETSKYNLHPKSKPVLPSPIDEKKKISNFAYDKHSLQIITFDRDPDQEKNLPVKRKLNFFDE
jgi:RNase adaptor protein for sRNA GlmZ degradation